jgi:hypothetical protein
VKGSLIRRFKEVFSNEQLEQLKDYIIDIERCAFGLTKVQCQKLVYNYAEKVGIAHCFNNVTRMAEDWLVINVYE